MKERNQDIMSAVQLVKKDPSILEKVAKNAEQPKKKTAKQIYGEATKTEKERATILSETKDIEAKIAQL